MRRENIVGQIAKALLLGGVGRGALRLHAAAQLGGLLPQSFGLVVAFAQQCTRGVEFSAIYDQADEQPYGRYPSRDAYYYHIHLQIKMLICRLLGGIPSSSSIFSVVSAQSCFANISIVSRITRFFLSE